MKQTLRKFGLEIAVLTTGIVVGVQVALPLWGNGVSANLSAQLAGQASSGIPPTLEFNNSTRGVAPAGKRADSFTEQMSGTRPAAFDQKPAGETLPFYSDPMGNPINPDQNPEGTTLPFYTDGNGNPIVPEQTPENVKPWAEDGAVNANDVSIWERFEDVDARLTNMESLVYELKQALEELKVQSAGSHQSALDEGNGGIGAEPLPITNEEATTNQEFSAEPMPMNETQASEVKECGWFKRNILGC